MTPPDQLDQLRVEIHGSDARQAFDRLCRDIKESGLSAAEIAKGAECSAATVTGLIHGIDPPTGRRQAPVQERIRRFLDARAMGRPLLPHECSLLANRARAAENFADASRKLDAGKRNASFEEFQALKREYAFAVWMAKQIGIRVEPLSELIAA